LLCLISSLATGEGEGAGKRGEREERGKGRQGRGEGNMVHGPSAATSTSSILFAPPNVASNMCRIIPALFSIISCRFPTVHGVCLDM